MTDDPTITDPELYSVLMENERVRVLAYHDRPGDQTHPHHHPDSVMVTLSDFRRRVTHGDQHTDVALSAGQTRWLDAQDHCGQNVGTTDSVAVFIELKEPHPQQEQRQPRLGPTL